MFLESGILYIFWSLKDVIVVEKSIVTLKVYYIIYLNKGNNERSKKREREKDYRYR